MASPKFSRGTELKGVELGNYRLGATYDAKQAKSE